MCIMEKGPCRGVEYLVLCDLLPCFCTFCRSAIPTSCYILNAFCYLYTVISNCIYLAEAQCHQHCVFVDIAFSSFQTGRLNEKLHGLESVVHIATFGSSTHHSVVQLKTREMPHIPHLQVLMFDPRLNWIWISMLTGIPTEVCQLVCSMPVC